MFQGTKDSRESGFQGIEDSPLLTGAFNELGVSKIQGFQGILNLRLVVTIFGMLWGERFIANTEHHDHWP